MEWCNIKTITKWLMIRVCILAFVRFLFVLLNNWTRILIIFLCVKILCDGFSMRVMFVAPANCAVVRISNVAGEKAKTAWLLLHSLPVIFAITARDHHVVHCDWHGYAERWNGGASWGLVDTRRASSNYFVFGRYLFVHFSCRVWAAIVKDENNCDNYVKDNDEINRVSKTGSVIEVAADWGSDECTKCKDWSPKTTN